jgi:hypothetical protein
VKIHNSNPYFTHLLIRLESITTFLPTGCWPGDGDAIFYHLDWSQGETINRVTNEEVEKILNTVTGHKS